MVYLNGNGGVPNHRNDLDMFNPTNYNNQVNIFPPIFQVQPDFLPDGLELPSMNTTYDNTKINGLDIVPTAYSNPVVASIYGPGVHTTIASLNSKDPIMFTNQVENFTSTLSPEDSIMSSSYSWTDKVRQSLLYMGLYGSVAVAAFGFGLYKDPNLAWLPLIGQPTANALQGVFGTYTGTFGLALGAVGTLGFVETTSYAF